MEDLDSYNLVGDALKSAIVRRAIPRLFDIIVPAFARIRSRRN